MNFENGSFGPFRSSEFDEVIELLEEDLNERDLSEHGKKVRLRQLANEIDSHRPEFYAENHAGLDIVEETYGASALYVHADHKGRVSLEPIVVAKSGNCFTADEATGRDREFIMPPAELQQRISAVLYKREV